MLTYASMESGYIIDHKKMEQVLIKYEAELTKYEGLWQSWFPGVNPYSPDQLLGVPHMGAPALARMGRNA